jgi:hypothetical protein
VVAALAAAKELPQLSLEDALEVDAAGRPEGSAPASVNLDQPDQWLGGIHSGWRTRLILIFVQKKPPEFQEEKRRTRGSPPPFEGDRVMMSARRKWWTFAQRKASDEPPHHRRPDGHGWSRHLRYRRRLGR